MATIALEEKIHKIRQQNEEIRRRHEEVEADKKNAAKPSATVRTVSPTDRTERKEPSRFADAPPKTLNIQKPKPSSREHRGQRQSYHVGGSEGKKIHVFAEGDGPPPDPGYNFLADSEREERIGDDSRGGERSRGRGGSSRGGPSRRRGSGRDGNAVHEYRGPCPGPRDATRPEYEAWRAERDRIDEARISRQRTAEGNWRREWDNNKVDMEDEESVPMKVARPTIGDAVRRDHKEFDKRPLFDGSEFDSARGRGGPYRAPRAALRGSHNGRGYHHTNSYEQFHGPVSPTRVAEPLLPIGSGERTIVATDKSIKIIVNQGGTVPKGPLMSVKVSSPSIAGTGRVGPRQKTRVLYSSQSEAEAMTHELEGYSHQKSVDDNSNRVHFIHDANGQHRPVPKSPHPQGKGEGSTKSPYLQRKEFKDTSWKSPRPQRKADLANRDPHTRKRANFLGNETPKSPHPQRRMSEKSRTDSPKSPLPRMKLADNNAPMKPEDSNVPTAQMPARRNDKPMRNVDPTSPTSPKGIQSESADDAATQLDKSDTGLSDKTSKSASNNDNSREGDELVINETNTVGNLAEKLEDVRNILRPAEDLANPVAIQQRREQKNENNEDSEANSSHKDIETDNVGTTDTPKAIEDKYTGIVELGHDNPLTSAAQSHVLINESTQKGSENTFESMVKNIETNAAATVSPTKETTDDKNKKVCDSKELNTLNDMSDVNDISLYIKAVEKIKMKVKDEGEELEKLPTESVQQSQNETEAVHPLKIVNETAATNNLDSESVQKVLTEKESEEDMILYARSQQTNPN